MGEVPRGEDRSTPIRRLARLVEPIHTVCYYAPEINGFKEHGFRGWWHSYFGYRSAPMGEVTAPVVTATFYNFAPRMVERAVPGCWSVMGAREVRELQVELTGAALERCFATYDDPAGLAAAAATLRSFVSELPVGARPLYAAWAAQDWPAEEGTKGDLLSLWHACTLLREFRFDGHNVALAAGELDGCECHAMMTSHGHGNAETIQAIRGWTADEWAAAVERLVARGWLHPDGTQTPEGTAARRRIEEVTDELSAPALAGLDDAATQDLLSQLERVVKHLVDTGEVAGVWPPPHVIVSA